ncbi:MAG: hypothetical protein J3K34DRAFT_515775 [Monoraphidium minutum]|nr:MAG: hypothetical protein J3K34DRAFT_515775 [Monoraphidium minutum]
MLLNVSRWMRKTASWRKFWANTSVFFVLQCTILILKHRLSVLAPELEPPLDYRPGGYTADDAMAVMRGYGPEARGAAAMLEVADCLYSGAYAVLFSGLLALSLSVTGAPEALHAINLVPITAAVIDVLENWVMLALLAAPREELARVAVAASAAKWQLLMATASVVGGSGAFCVYKALTSGAPRTRRGGGGGVAGGAAGATDAAGGGRATRKTASRRA